MSLLRILLVDDEPLAVRRLELLVARIAGFEICGSAGGCREGLEATARLNPDIVLLDIRMRDGSGFDYLAALPPDAMPAIVFVTAFDSHAIEAFTHNALDYVLKPIEQNRLAAALERARTAVDQRRRAQHADELHEVIANLRERIRCDAVPAYDGELWIRKNVTGFERVTVDEIEWIASEEDYVRICAGERSYLLRSTLNDLQSRLDPARFLRIHRSTIVRKDAVLEFRRDTFGFHALLLSGRKLRVGRIHAKQLKQELAKYER